MHNLRLTLPVGITMTYIFTFHLIFKAFIEASSAEHCILHQTGEPSETLLIRPLFVVP